MSAEWVLGLNVGLHDASAALLHRGELVAMAEQERLSRNKRANGESPAQAIESVLRQAGIQLRDVKVVAAGTDVDRLIRWLGPQCPEPVRSLLSEDRVFPSSLFGTQRFPAIRQIPHHVAHAASAFWPSGFEDAAVLVVDNRGEDCSTMIGHATRAGIEVLREFPIDASLGVYYRTAAAYAGLCGPTREVGKFMGLAGYGRPGQDVALTCDADGPRFTGLGSVSGILNADLANKRTEQLLEFFTTNCYPFGPSTGEEIFAYADFAASVQEALESCILELCRQAQELTGSRKLVLAGGVALNCSANGKVAASGMFDEIYIQPAAHDSGVAIGAAYEAFRETGSLPVSRIDHAYFGAAFSFDEIQCALDEAGLAYEVLDEDALAKRVAGLLAEHATVGWFQGRAEIGPRALGARSILGNPTLRRTLVRLNNIKEREMWRPLAPSLMAECIDEFFETPASPFMLVAVPVRNDAMARVPATVHIDGSARPQIVEKATNPRFWKLLDAFRQLTGVGLLVNTSFNTAREPIVHTPANAIRTFLETDLDSLAIGNFLIQKSKSRQEFVA